MKSRTELDFLNRDKGTVTIQQVADHAGVSTATVSRVMANSERVSEKLTQKVLKSVAELEFSPNRTASSLRTKRTKRIGVIISDIQNPFFTSVIRGIEEVLEEYNFVLFLCNTDEDPAREKIQIRTLISEGVEGIIIATSHSDFDTHIRLTDRISIVAIDRTYNENSLDAVSVTNKHGVYEAVSHLLSLGHQSIGFIGGPKTLSTSNERFEGYKDALLSKDLQLTPNYYCYSDFRQAGGYKAMKDLLRLSSPPSAVVVANNLMTLGALEAINESKLKIPDDIAIIGFDDMSWAPSLNPPLTAIAQPTYELGKVAAELLLDRLKDKDRPYRTVLLNTQLIIRASCGGRLMSQ